MAKTTKLDLTFDAKPAGAPRKFVGIAYSGGVVPDYAWLGDVAIDLATLKNPDGRVPALVDHDRRIDKIAGHGELALDDGALVIAGELTDATETGRTIAALLAANFPLQMSVGITGELVELKAPELINGRMMSVRHVFRNAEVMEVSFVPVGADRDTAAAASFNRKQESTMTRSAEDTALIEAKDAEITALKAEIGDLKNQMKAQAEMARKAALTALFAEVGKEMPEKDDALAPYLSMTDAAFAAYAADLRALRPQHDPALFSRQSVALGQAGGESLLIAEAKRRAA